MVLKDLLEEGTSHLPAVQNALARKAQLQRQIAEQENEFVQAYRATLIQRLVIARKVFENGPLKI